MNENCLKGLRCPNKECGSYGPFEITATCDVSVYDDGTEEAVNFQWDEDAYCKCEACGRMDTVRDFQDDYVVVNVMAPEEGVVFGPAKMELCKSFVLGVKYDALEMHMKYVPWEEYKPEEED